MAELRKREQMRDERKTLRKQARCLGRQQEDNHNNRMTTQQQRQPNYCQRSNSRQDKRSDNKTIGENLSTTTTDDDDDDDDIDVVGIHSDCFWYDEEMAEESDRIRTESERNRRAGFETGIQLEKTSGANGKWDWKTTTMEDVTWNNNNSLAEELRFTGNTVLTGGQGSFSDDCKPVVSDRGKIGEGSGSSSSKCLRNSHRFSIVHILQR